MTNFLNKSGDVRITNALVFDGQDPELVERDVIIRDGLIVSADEDDQDGVIAGPIIDARGGVVTPGFIDAHFHAYAESLNMWRNESRLPSYLALVGAGRLRRALGRGFTTVRDVAGGDIGLHRAIELGLIDSPRYFYSGAALSQTGGHGDPTAQDATLCFHGGPTLEVVDGADNLRVAVRTRLRSGAHAIKIMASGGVISPVDPIRIPQYSAEEIQAVTDEAIRQQSYVVAHAYSSAAIEHVVANGVRSVEHGNLLNAETAAIMATHGAFLVPTLITYDAMNRRGVEYGLTDVGLAKNSEVLEYGRNAIELASQAGVSVGFGSDLMGDLEDEQLGGLRLQAEVVGVLETLRSVTSVNAALLRKDSLGRIRPGGVGDVLIFAGNPLERAELLWDESSRIVVQAGVRVGTASS